MPISLTTSLSTPLTPMFPLFAAAENRLPFGLLEFSLILLYLAGLVAVGCWGYAARKEDSLRDFYLAGPGIGFFVLLFTLYATQYSGNTLIGFTGKTYEQGFRWTVSVHFMTAIVVFYCAFAPKLFRIAKRESFITPADFVAWRFKMPVLTLVTSTIMIFGVANFLVGQLIAMGRAMQGMTDWNPFTAFICGVVFLAFVVVIYESLGGFRAVVWTDAIQGVILAIGFAILLVVVLQQIGSLPEATETLLESDRALLEESTSTEIGTQAHPPGTRHSLEWLSYILIVGMGGALYPQAIQRIYAARRARALRDSLTVMAFMPLVTTLVSLVVGIIAAAQLDPSLIEKPETVLPEICRQIQETSLAGRVLVAVLFAAILAALMSTADSILLSISSMVTRDFVPLFVSRETSESGYTKIGKFFSWLLMILAVGLAIGLEAMEKANLISLLDRKFDILVQLVPAFMIGVHWRGMKAMPVLLGIVTGVVIALTIVIHPDISSRPWGIHPGLFGLLANLIVCVAGSRMLGSDAEAASSHA